MLPSCSQGTACQLGITIQRKLPFPSGSSKRLRIRSHWTSIGHMLLLLQSPWDRVLQLAQPEGGVESALGEQRGTQRRVNMKGTDRDMETRQTSRRSPSSRSEGACLGSSASNSESIYSCAMCLAVIPGASWGPAVCQVSAGSEISIPAVSKTLRLYRCFVLVVWNEVYNPYTPTWVRPTLQDAGTHRSLTTVQQCSQKRHGAS